VASRHGSPEALVSDNGSIFKAKEAMRIYAALGIRDASTIRCSNEVVIPFQPGATILFPEETCQTCPLRERCTTSVHGRSVHIHPDERLLDELRQRQLSPQGRAKLRERVAVEHALAHMGRWQGSRARYRGTRKNLFDLRRCAVVHNLHVLQRMPLAQIA